MPSFNCTCWLIYKNFLQIYLVIMKIFIPQICTMYLAIFLWAESLTSIRICLSLSVSPFLSLPLPLPLSLPLPPSPPFSLPLSFSLSLPLPPSFSQLSWSSSSDHILIIGNGKDSPALLYSLQESRGEEGEERRKEGEGKGIKLLQLLWITQASITKTRESTAESHDSKSHEQTDKSHDRTGRDYMYNDAFYMGEINPSNNIFVIEERQDACTLMHLLDAVSGSPLKTTPLHSLTGSREVHTLMMSSLHHGRYVVMVEGGYVVVVTGEELEVVNIFNVVSYWIVMVVSFHICIS